MTWWHYLLLANVYLTLFFGFYALFLRRETFFNMNRVYLVSSALLSFFIPVIQSDWIRNLFITRRVQETIYQVGPAMMYQFNVTATSTAPQAHQFTMGEIIGGIYVIGILVLTLRFVYQLAVINWVISQPKSDTSYSFFNRIQVEDRDADNDVITAHEEAHARQWHSADVLLLEAIMILNWFNPVVYWYRNAVKHIHEFIADRDALKNGTNKAEYAMLLLSQTFTTPPYHLVNPFFNQSLLKQRILMLHKNRSQRIKLTKYFLSAPLFGLMLVLSSATVNNSKAIKTFNNTAQEVFNAPFDEGGANGAGQGNGAGRPHELSAEDKEDLYQVIKQHEAAAARAAMQNSQAANANEIKGELFTSVEHPAEFPGGIDDFYHYIVSNISYPTEARQKNIQGKVFATFVVEKDGSITEPHILRGIGGGADEETLRLITNMPKWKPGVQNGSKVRQQYTVPISFTLVDGGSRNRDTATKVYAQLRNNNPMSAGTYPLANNALAAAERPQPDTADIRAYMTNQVSIAPATVLDAKMNEVVKAQKIAPKNLSGLDVMKERIATGMLSKKATNGIVLMVTKHKPFYDQESLGN